MKFDDFYSLINDWGKYQRVKYILICLSYMLPSIMVYTYSFTAAKPKFRCENPQLERVDQFNEDFNEIYALNYLPNATICSKFQGKLSIDECQRCFRRNFSVNDENRSIDSIEECQIFVYDRSFYLETLTEKWNMVCHRVTYRSTIQMIFFLGYMFGSILFGILADKYGRRPIMTISFLLMTLSSFLCALGPDQFSTFSYSYSIFVVGRFLLACSTRGISVSGFVLGSEIVGPRKRLLTGIVIEYFFAFGQFILLLFAFFIRSWKTLTSAISIFTIPYLFFYFILPESPRWLISRSRFNQAEQILKQIAKTNDRPFDHQAFLKLKNEEIKRRSESKSKDGVQSLFQSKIMAMISLNLFFQWSYKNLRYQFFLFSYLDDLFFRLVQNLVFYGVSQNTGAWELNPYLSFGLSAFVELLGYIFVHLILDRFGRKTPYYSFVFLFSFLSFLIIPIQYFFESKSYSRTFLLNSINISLKFCASASYSIIYIYANELFPTNVRNTGMGICSMVARIGAIIGTFANDSFSRIWIHLPIMIYASFSIIAAFLSLMFPETLYHSLPQTVDDVHQMVLSKKTRKQYEFDYSSSSPPNYISNDGYNEQDEQITRF